MQIKEAQRAQTDFVPRANNNVKISGIQQDNNDAAKTFGEQEETYEPSEEALLRLYLDHMKEAQERSSAANEERVDITKLLRIAFNIMGGKQVPSKDESYLVKHNLALYMAAKNMGSLRKPSGKAKSVFDNSRTSASSPADAAGRNTAAGTTGNSSITDSSSTEFAGNNTTAQPETPKTPDEIANGTAEAILENANGALAAKNNSFDISKYQTTSERTYGSSSASSSSKTKKVKKKYKRLNYNFKLVSSQILKAKTSASARKAAGRARRQTTELRKKMMSADYDTTYVRIALTHAEAIERVAKKKIKHLLEEESLKRGGPCNGDNDRFDKEEQKKLDEQAFREMLGNYNNEAPKTEGEAMVALFSEVTGQPAPEEVIDLDELMIEFQKLMEDSFDELGSLDDLADELLSETIVEMDPEDLKMLKIKHRSKEQQEIAEADARYLRAFFDKLQKEQAQTSAAISQMAEAAAADTPIIISANTGAAPSMVIASNPSAPAAGGTTAPAAGGTANVSTPSASAGSSADVNIGSFSANIGTTSIDVSI